MSAHDDYSIDPMVLSNAAPALELISGGLQRRERRIFTPSAISTICRLAAQGKSASQIAEAIGSTSASVRVKYRQLKMEYQPTTVLIIPYPTIPPTPGSVRKVLEKPKLSKARRGARRNVVLFGRFVFYRGGCGGRLRSCNFYRRIIMGDVGRRCRTWRLPHFPGHAEFRGNSSQGAAVP